MKALWGLTLILSAICVISGIYLGVHEQAKLGFGLVICGVVIVYLYTPLVNLIKKIKK